VLWPVALQVDEIPAPRCPARAEGDPDARVGIAAECLAEPLFGPALEPPLFPDGSLLSRVDRDDPVAELKKLEPLDEGRRVRPRRSITWRVWTGSPGSPIMRGAHRCLSWK